MNLVSTYSVKIKKFNHIFDDTVRLYRDATDFYIAVIKDNWTQFSNCTSGEMAVRMAEELSVITKNRSEVKYDFGEKFYKFPSYLRRVSIAQAFGLVRSYQSNRSNWEAADKNTRGKQPSAPKSGFVSPCMYRDNCFIRTGTYTARLKVYIRNTWDWVDVEFRKSDVDYIIHHCSDKKECTPVLRKRGKEWYLDFSFTTKRVLMDEDIKERKIISVDLGINSSCTCVCMKSDGTVVGRRFLRLSKEYDSLTRKISHIKRAQRHGSRILRKMWTYADGINDDIAVKTAAFIIDTAQIYGAGVIVFEHLSLQGKKRGSKKQKLHLWKAKNVQKMVTHKAHMHGMRVSTIHPKNTSRLAFDGSGRVKRGKESEKTRESYSLCEFQNEKVYNCDLNAAYNIGARYFVRLITKSLPVTVGQRITAKVPECAMRSTCTLSTLIRLNAELYDVS